MKIYIIRPKETRTMTTPQYKEWLIAHADSIGILGIRNNGFSPVIEMYKDKKYLPQLLHGVKANLSEMAAIQRWISKFYVTKNRYVSFKTLKNGKRSGF